MANMSSDQLRDISIAVVEDFLNNKVPLSQGLAKQASLNDLNTEQIHRCVEASNTIAHLKLMSMAEDRTFEFPLCKYAEVMRSAAVPQIEKVANTTGVVETAPFTGIEKSAGVTSVEGDGYAINPAEAKVFLIKEAAANRRALEEIESQANVLRADLSKCISDIKQDPTGLDKIACVVDSWLVGDITSLVYGEPKAVRDFGLGKEGLFKEAELKSVTDIQSLYKQVRELSKEASYRRSLDARVSAIEDSLQKEALFAAAGRALGAVAGKAIGSVAGLATKPIRALASATTQAAKTKSTEPFGVFGKSVGGLATLGMNAGMLAHTPAPNRATGASKDVWDALQS